jgi:hypothetical protein
MKYIEPKEAWMYIQATDGSSHNAEYYTRIPQENGWEEIIYLHEPIVDPSGAIRKPEWVYVLVNQSMPGMVKIGMTTSTVEERAKQINAATGVPTPWIPVYKFRCYGSRYLEQEVHKYLNQNRINDHREMFDIDAITAQKVIERIGVPYANALYVASEINKI